MSCFTKILLPCLLLVANLVADYEVSCDQLDYLDRQLMLNGHVIVNVMQNAELSCSKAFLDREGGHGIFDEGEGSPYAKVQGQFIEGTGPAIPLSLEGRRIELWSDDMASVRELVAEGDATLRYGHDWTATGDSARFRRDPAGGDDLMAGEIELLGRDEAGCVVEHSGGSRISARKMILNTIDRRLILTSARGHIHHADEGDKQLQIDFKADSATWSHPDRLLTLLGNVVIDQSEGRQLTSQGEVRLVCRDIDQGLRLQSIECDGPTEIIIDGGREKIRCQGHCVADIESQQLVLSSPTNAEGRVPLPQQLVFNGPEGEMSSDNLTLFYGMAGREMAFSGFLADGHVCLKRPSGNRTQYALSDALKYQRAKGELLFEARSGRRVLFFDQQYDIKISAPSVSVKRDAKGKETIRGLGDVRLTLLDQELARLRERFNLKAENEK